MEHANKTVNVPSTEFSSAWESEIDVPKPAEAAHDNDVKDYQAQTMQRGIQDEETEQMPNMPWLIPCSIITCLLSGCWCLGCAAIYISLGIKKKWREGHHNTSKKWARLAIILICVTTSFGIIIWALFIANAYKISERWNNFVINETKS